MSIDAVSTQPVSGRVSKPGDQGHHQTDSDSAKIVLVNGGRHSAREPEVPPISQSPIRRSSHAVIRPLSSDADGRRSADRFRQLRSEPAARV